LPHWLLRESVNRSQMDIKHKTRDDRTWKKKLLLDISYTNVDTFAPYRYQCVETRSMKVFWLAFPHFVGHHLRLFNVLRKLLYPVVNCFTWKTRPIVNRKYSFINILCIQFFYPQETSSRTLLLRSIIRCRCHFNYWNQPLNMSMLACYLDCLEAGLCLLPNDTHRKPITSITSVLIPFVAYLLSAFSVIL
jgi:hypothetical protein